jgi:primosomal protein N' (replication factor Y)
LFDARSVALAQWVADMYLCSVGEALGAMLPGGRREVEPEAVDDGPLPGGGQVVLSEEQRLAIARIASASSGFFYLFGVTGSGKTEVFLQASREMLRRGRGVIYLVPEISLTHQVVDVFQRFLGEEVAVLHSGLTPSQRLQGWRRLREGTARVAIGARSAVFAPVQRLGLVIIDEEHEASYKSGTTPRYHARQVAMHRASEEGALLVMGSATPSLEAYHAMKTGRVENLRLPERLSGGSMPSVEIRDLRGEKGPISRPLIAEIRRTHAEGRQSILFLNRRGFAHFFHCRSCGFEMKCRRCSVSLTFHKHSNRMVCHYCGYRSPPVEVCPSCGSMDVGYSGFGTERIEEEVQRLFPELQVRRVDTDAVRGGDRGLLRRTLADFAAGKIDVLLGTQMVAKGLNFPLVKLVGIIAADTGLQLPDFRAAERTFGLIVQVSGRAGRFHPDGKVVIQTFQPDSETIRLAAAGKLEEFYEKELEARRQLGFPPFTRLGRLVLRSRSSRKAWSAAQGLADSLAGLGSQPGQGAGQQAQGGEAPAVEVLGPAECPLATVAGNHRVQLLLRASSLRLLHNRLKGLLQEYVAPSGVYLEVDVDPVSLL